MHCPTLLCFNSTSCPVDNAGSTQMFLWWRRVTALQSDWSCTFTWATWLHGTKTCQALTCFPDQDESDGCGLSSLLYMQFLERGRNFSATPSVNQSSQSWCCTLHHIRKLSICYGSHFRDLLAVLLESPLKSSLTSCLSSHIFLYHKHKNVFHRYETTGRKWRHKIKAE